MAAFTSFQKALRDQRSKSKTADTSDMEIRQCFMECNSTMNNIQGIAIDLSQYTMYSESL